MSTIKSTRFDNLLPLFQSGLISDYNTAATAVATAGAGATPVQIQALDDAKKLLGTSPDERPRLYLGALSEAYNAERDKGILPAKTVAQSLQLSDKMPELINLSFEPKDTTIGDNAIHPEWGNFKADMVRMFPAAVAAAGGTPAIPAGIAITNVNLLNIIKSLAGSVLTNNERLKEFQQEIVKLHFKIEDATATVTDITDMPDQWKTATQITTRPGIAGRAPGFLFIMVNVTPGTVTTNVTNFNWKLSNYILHKKMEASAIAPVASSDSFWASTDPVSNNYYRLASDRSKLYTNDASGNKVDVTKGSDYFNKKFKESGTCSSHYVKDSGALKCGDYLLKCITSGDEKDITACRDFMLDVNFWEVTQKEVDEMLPTNAEDTLRRFGFQTEVKDNLIVFQPIGEWFKQLQTHVDPAAVGTTGPVHGKISKTELDNIMKNDKLKAYLGLLLTKVNSNPSILNKNYNTPYNFDAADHDNSFASWGLKKMGLTPIYKFTSNNDSSYVSRLSSLVSNNLLTLGSSMKQYITLDSRGGVLVGGLPYVLHTSRGVQMFGGDGDENMYGGSSALIRSSGQAQIRENYPLLKTLFNYIEKSVESKGKSLSDDTKKQIQDHLEKYKETEQKLFKAIRYADKYLDLVEIYGKYDKDNVLSIDHLKKFVEARDKYHNRATGKQNDILSAFEQMFSTFLENLRDEIKNKQ